jgi:hypothetical protein
MFLSWPSEMEVLRTTPVAGLDRDPQPTITGDDRATALIRGGRDDGGQTMRVRSGCHVDRCGPVCRDEPPSRMGPDLAAAHPNTASRGGPA